MQKNKKQTFMQGAMILVAGTLIAKLISAAFKIPLQHYIGNTCMGIFNSAYQYYTIMFVIATAGVPVALSKLVSEANALGRGHEVKRIAKLAAVVFFSFGALCSVGLFIGADLIARLSNNPMAIEAIRAISPAVFFVSVVAVVRGYFQGMSNMIPTALSQIIEAVGKVVLGLLFAWFAGAKGFDDPMKAAFAILGVTVGEILAAMVMLIYAASASKKSYENNLNDRCRSYRELLRVLLLTVIPVTLTSSVTSITTLVDTGMLVRRLQEIGYTLQEANALYGVYTGQAFTMFNFPQTLITALATAVLPAMAGAYAQQNHTMAAKNMGSAMRIAMLIALPACIGYIVLAHPIIELLFAEDSTGMVDAGLGGSLLQVLAIAIPCVALVGLTNAILQAIGQMKVPVITMLIGGLCKIGLNYFLVGNPKIHIYGAPVGTLACYTLIATLNLIYLKQYIKLPNIDKLFIRPFAACIGMGAVAAIVYRPLSETLGNAAVLPAICVAALVYVILLVGLNALERDDILMLPAGKHIVKMLRL